ncbi:MAG: radical SAM protein [Candidatus Omnitrophica bacterium]|nr:radical SAM protein [Candidatus Omnitrophota bacterium]
MVTLINPPSPPKGVSNKDTMAGFGQVYEKSSCVRMPVLDILYAAGSLKQNNVETNVIDCVLAGFSPKELIKELLSKRPSLLGIRVSTPTINWDLSVIKKIKQRLNVKVVVFGPHTLIDAENIIKNPYVDALIQGEPELAFLDIVTQGFKDCPGLWFKNNGSMIKNEKRKFIDNLDSLCFPAWELVPYQNNHIGDGRPFFTILSSRGCSFGCRYCPYLISQGRTWRKRSPASVVDEIEYLIKNFGMRSLLFRDPEFTLDGKRTEEICSLIIERGLKFGWRCETRIDTLDKNLLLLMKRSGCKAVNLGVESFSSAALELMKRKAIPQEKITETVDFCRQIGIDTYCFFILGLPGETVEDVFKTIAFALKINPSRVQFTFPTPYPKTSLYERAKKRGLSDNISWDKFTGFDVVTGNEHISRRKLRKLIFFARQVTYLYKHGLRRGPFYRLRMLRKKILLGLKILTLGGDYTWAKVFLEGL